MFPHVALYSKQVFSFAAFNSFLCFSVVSIFLDILSFSSFLILLAFLFFFFLFCCFFWRGGCVRGRCGFLAFYFQFYIQIKKIQYRLWKLGCPHMPYINPYYPFEHKHVVVFIFIIYYSCVYVYHNGKPFSTCQVLFKLLSMLI